MPTHRLRVGSRVHYDGDDHKVAALRGGAVELHGMHGGISLVLMSALLTATDFRLLDEPHAPIEPIFPDNIGAAAVNEARVLARHLMEAITGYASGTNLDAASTSPSHSTTPSDTRCSSASKRRQRTWYVRARHLAQETATRRVRHLRARRRHPLDSAPIASMRGCTRFSPR